MFAQTSPHKAHVDRIAAARGVVHNALKSLRHVHDARAELTIKKLADEVDAISKIATTLVESYSEFQRTYVKHCTLSDLNAVAVVPGDLTSAIREATDVAQASTPRSDDVDGVRLSDLSRIASS